MRVFNNAVDAQNPRLALRCVVTVVNVGNSADERILQRLDVDARRYAATMRQTLTAGDATRFADAIEYLENNVAWS